MGRGEAYVVYTKPKGHGTSCSTPSHHIPPRWHYSLEPRLTGSQWAPAILLPVDYWTTGTQMTMPWALGIWTVSHAVHKCSHSLSQLFSSNIHISNMHWSFDKGLCPNTFPNKIKTSPQKAHSPPFPAPSWILISCFRLSSTWITGMYHNAWRQAFLFCLPDIIHVCENRTGCSSFPNVDCGGKKRAKNK